MKQPLAQSIHRIATAITSSTALPSRRSRHALPMLLAAIVALGITATSLAEQPGDICATAIPITDGLTGSDLIGFTPSGVESSCAPAANADRWYRYNSTCTGVVTVSLCTDLIESNVAIASYVVCPTGPHISEQACGDSHPNCFAPVQNALNARAH